MDRPSASNLAALHAQLTQGVGLMRWLLMGSIVVLHGLTHAVLHARGMGHVEETELARTLANFAWGAPLLMFVASGLGLMGAEPFQRFGRPLALVGSWLSLIALHHARMPDLWPMGLLDVFFALGATLGVILAQRERRPPVRSVGTKIASALAVLALGWVSFAVMVAGSAQPLLVTVAAPPERVLAHLPEAHAFQLVPLRSGHTRVVVEPRSVPVFKSALSLLMLDLPRASGDLEALVDIKQRLEHTAETAETSKDRI